MTAAVGKYAAKKLLGKQMDKYKHKEVGGIRDPYFEDVKLPDGRTKKVKRQIPDFIPEHDALVLARAKKYAYRLDMCLFNFMGIRFGWESVIGLVPGFGDVVGGLWASKVFLICNGIEGGLPMDLKLMMLMTIVADIVIGLVPFLGDLLDAYFKCNTRNVWMLEKHLRKKYGPSNKQQRESAGREAWSDEQSMEDMRQLRMMGVKEDMGRTNDKVREEQASGLSHNDVPITSKDRWQHQEQPEQKPASDVREEPHGGKRSWFGGWNRHRHHDLETGPVA